ncbi:unnamed protein product [Hermetia illucens]|uniref:DUF4604 domain-containing protein n=1 Tax=Hermetia illucens TaxID=343691 RepID=A0A7R8ULU7_HERIL|nr:uncharacterized protein KIAA1143 homolog isoform X3 [Hermetia illucens]XP_037904231.1 uncharacterized protein KIAA1143 homolog isoform X3 [Hermetia illucens]CAD7083248.1 unnamed protein product [Hermetia illucens]
MSKRNVTYVKPQDPTFLRRLKEQIGYQEGPNIDTKRQKIEDLSGSDSDLEEHSAGGSRSGDPGASSGRKLAGDREDEKPQVVVLEEGDLTAAEAEAERARIEKEEREKPADLNQRIIFKAKHKPTKDSNSVLANSSNENREKEEKKSKKRSKDTKKVSKLSFNQDDDEEGEDN